MEILSYILLFAPLVLIVWTLTDVFLCRGLCQGTAAVSFVGALMTLPLCLVLFFVPITKAFQDPQSALLTTISVVGYAAVGAAELRK